MLANKPLKKKIEKMDWFVFLSESRVYFRGSIFFLNYYKINFCGNFYFSMGYLNSFGTGSEKKK